MKSLRKSLGHWQQFMDLPNLNLVNSQEQETSIEIKGLDAILKKIFPILLGNVVIEYKCYKLVNKDLTVKECEDRGLTYEAKLQVLLRFISLKKIVKVKEQKVSIGYIPLMTKKGDFMINGIPRVIISQLHRSPGVFFGFGYNQKNLKVENANLIPFIGCWLYFEFEEEKLFVSFDRLNKQPVTVLLRAMGMSAEEMLLYFCNKNVYNLIGSVLSLSPRWVPIEDMIGKKVTGRCCNVTEISTLKEIEKLLSAGLTRISTLSDAGFLFSKTLQIDTSSSQADALLLLYISNSNSNSMQEETQDMAVSDFKERFYMKENYDLSNVGRMKINRRLRRDSDLGPIFLTKKDILSIISELINIRNGLSTIDDRDNLGNRRMRSVGEIVKTILKLSATSKIKERILPEPETQEPDLSKLFVESIKDFLNSSQLAQFRDQNNPLAELTHKRRVSTLGPGGITREIAGLDVRDVHPTYYGRLCPIETPEGKNIGLVNSLATYSYLNSYGFLETPYCKIVNSKVTKDIIFLSAIEESHFVIAQATSMINENRFVEEVVQVRLHGEPTFTTNDQVMLIDVSPTQILSIAAALIPFIEHNDANRALMGSNMQRQAVPPLRPETPLVGTGMERFVAQDSGVCIIARRGGKVSKVDAKRIVIRVNEKERYSSCVDIYTLSKYGRTNQKTCKTQRTIVHHGDIIESGDIIASETSVDQGDIALGQNMRVAFMPWKGYNYEDAIIISEKVVQEDRFTTIHIKELICSLLDTKLGPEELLKNSSEAKLKKLDDSGIVYLGAKINQGDILVGKRTPTKEVVEKKKKEKQFKDTSMRAGVDGTVIDVKIVTRDGVKKDNRTLAIEQMQYSELLNEIKETLHIVDNATFSRLQREFSGEAELPRSRSQWFDLQIKDKRLKYFLSELKEKRETYLKEMNAILERESKKLNKSNEMEPRKIIKIYIAVRRRIKVGDKMAGRHGNKGVISAIKPIEDMPFDDNGETVDIVLNPLGVPSRMNVGQILESKLGMAAHGLGVKINSMLRTQNLANLRSLLKTIYKNKKIDSLSDYSLIELAKNMSNGVLFATQVFSGASEEDISVLFKLANIPESGQFMLYDGSTGDKFDLPITVGYMYMFKLNHLVDDKIHARSTGSYSQLTQQPLGGKAKLGGQRLGEMEVWALEAYGAAYTLQEMLTVKSDHIEGRAGLYKTIVEGNKLSPASIPESFKVLLKEIRSLGLDLEFK